MSAKKKSTTKTGRKTAKKKPTTTRKRTVTARAKKPKKPKAPPARLEVKKPAIEITPQVEKPVRVRPVAEVEKPHEVKPAVKLELEKPAVEAKVVEVKEQVVEAKPEVKKHIEVKIAAKPEVEKPAIEAKVVEVKEHFIEAKPEVKIPIVEVRPEAAKPVEFKPTIKREVEEAIEVKRGVEAKAPVLLPKPLRVKPALKPEAKKQVRVQKPLVAAPTERVALVIRLRGEFGVPEHIERTLASLRLKRKYNATLVQNAASVIGMLRRVKDYVTWGDIKSIDIARLLKERGELRNGLSVSDKFAKDAFSKESVDELAKAISNGQTSLRSLWQKGVKPVFRLHPPSGGFDTTAKRPYGSHGQLGYRGTAITRLMTQMT